LVMADQYLGQISSLDDVAPVVRVNHALLRFNEENYDAVLPLIEDLADTEAVAGHVAALAIRTAAAQSRWREAISWAARPSVDPQEVAWLAGQLAENGRLADARRLLSVACPELNGPNQQLCSTLLMSLGGPI